ncbi:unnamed protein product [Amaranthus hypochondriacus]
MPGEVYWFYLIYSRCYALMHIAQHRDVHISNSSCSISNYSRLFHNAINDSDQNQTIIFNIQSSDDQQILYYIVLDFFLKVQLSASFSDQNQIIICTFQTTIKHKFLNANQSGQFGNI